MKQCMIIFLILSGARIIGMDNAEKSEKQNIPRIKSAERPALTPEMEEKCNILAEMLISVKTLKAVQSIIRPRGMDNKKKPEFRGSGISELISDSCRISVDLNFKKIIITKMVSEKPEEKRPEESGDVQKTESVKKIELTTEEFLKILPHYQKNKLAFISKDSALSPRE